MADPLSPQTSLSRQYGVGIPGTTDPTDLPLRELNDAANLDEYTEETREGEIARPVRSNLTGKIEDYNLVTFTVGDPGNPKNWSKAFKWYCTLVVAFTCFVVAFTSSVVTPGIEGLQEEFGISETVGLLTVTLFVIGFGVGMNFYQF